MLAGSSKKEEIKLFKGRLAQSDDVLRFLLFFTWKRMKSIVKNKYSVSHLNPFLPFGLDILPGFLKVNVGIR